MLRIFQHLEICHQKFVFQQREIDARIKREKRGVCTSIHFLPPEEKHTKKPPEKIFRKVSQANLLNFSALFYLVKLCEGSPHLSPRPWARPSQLLLLHLPFFLGQREMCLEPPIQLCTQVQQCGSDASYSKLAALREGGGGGERQGLVFSAGGSDFVK